MQNKGLVQAAVYLLGVGFILTAVGSIFTDLTPEGTGVNFPAGLASVGGMGIGALGLAFGIVALIQLRRM